jgi:hypothetical protein
MNGLQRFPSFGPRPWPKLGTLTSDTQFNGMWRSLAARLLWEQEVRGSNPRIPTT